MHSGNLFYLGTLAAASVYSLILTIKSLQRITTYGSRIVSAILAFISLYVIATLFEGMLTEIPEKVLSTKISYVGFYGAAGFLVILALHYSQRDHWLQNGLGILIWILPIVMIGTYRLTGTHGAVNPPGYNAQSPIKQFLRGCQSHAIISFRLIKRLTFLRI